MSTEEFCLPMRKSPLKKKFNCQNDRIQTPSSCEALGKAICIQRGHHPLSDGLVGCIRAWCNRDSFLRTEGENEQCSLSKHAGKSNSTSGGYHLHRYIGLLLPAGLSSVHKVKLTQMWLSENMPDFIRLEEWCSANPDLNPQIISSGSLLTPQFDIFEGHSRERSPD